MNLSEILSKHGPLGLALLLLAAMLWRAESVAQTERAQHTAILVDQLTDLREKVNERCRGP